MGVTNGMDLRMTQPASTISGIILSNQSCSAIIYEGFETLVAVGLVSKFYSPLDLKRMILSNTSLIYTLRFTEY